jgi:MYXO-CTERM domain-containing protein
VFWLSLVALGSAASPLGVECHTAELAGLSDRAAGGDASAVAALDALGLTARGPAVPWASAAPPDHKAVRAPYGEVEHRVESDNFVLWWGNDNLSFGEADMAALIDLFEDVWDAEVGGIGYPPPQESEGFKFNIYMGTTDPALPEIGGGAYFYWDVEGHPMIVVHPGMLYDPSGVAAHEFFHALQAACGSYQYEGQGAWFYEASANWMPTEVFPSLHETHDSLWAIIMRPELPINFFQYPVTWTPEEIHQYGAWIFVEYLDEWVGGPTFIRDVWMDGPLGGDPMVVIGEMDDGLTRREMFFDFTVRNATWDYAHGDLHAQISEASQWDPDAHWVSGTLRGTDEAWDEPQFPPYTYGVNYWTLRKLPETFQLELDQLERGTTFFAALAWEQGGVHHRLEVPIDSDVRSGTLLVTDGEVPAEAWLVVAAASDTVDDGKTYPYRVRVVDPPPEEEPSTTPTTTEITTEPTDEVVPSASPKPAEQEQAAGCGCATPGGPGGVWPLALLLVALRRTRRSQKLPENARA